MKTLKRKILSLFLALSLALSLSAPALAATPEEAQDDVELLYNLGLFLGSGTNADGITLSRGGVRTGLISLPLRYMHTPAEVVRLSDMEAIGRLLAAWLCWEEK